MEQPSSYPMEQPSSYPMEQPSSYPVEQPSSYPMEQPSSYPMEQPGSYPIEQPSSYPIEQPSSYPIEQPSSYPTEQPSAYSTQQTSSQPTPKASSYIAQKSSRYAMESPDSTYVMQEPGSTFTVQQPTSAPVQQPTSVMPPTPAVNPYAGIPGSPLADMSPQKVAMWQRRFNAIDLNKDGMISLREMAAVGRVLGYALSVEELCEIFHKRDLDDSGGISFEEFVQGMQDNVKRRQELQPVRDRFREYDYRGRGYITAEDAFPVLRKELGFDMNKTESLIDQYDKNRDYKLSIGEFNAFYKRVCELKAQVQIAFNEFDTDNDGFITYEEAKSVMMKKGFTDAQVYEYFIKYDADGDGRLDYGEFARFWDIPIF